MTLTRRPDRNPVQLRNALDRLFGDWSLVPVDMGFSDVMPAMDVREVDDSYVVEVDLPGVSPDDTEVMIEGRTLTIRGRYADEAEREAGNFLLRERRRGQFLRALALPGMVDVDNVTSRYENGQLIITLPKAASSRARKIQISATAGNGSKSRGSKAEEGSKAQALGEGTRKGESTK